MNRLANVPVGLGLLSRVVHSEALMLAKFYVLDAYLCICTSNFLLNVFVYVYYIFVFQYLLAEYVCICLLHICISIFACWVYLYMCIAYLYLNICVLSVFVYVYCIFVFQNLLAECICICVLHICISIFFAECICICVLHICISIFVRWMYLYMCTTYLYFNICLLNVFVFPSPPKTI